MSSHPTLTTAVYIGIAIAFIAVLTYWFLYTRGLKTKQATLDKESHLPVSPQEGIAIATEEKERSGRTGTIS